MRHFLTGSTLTPCWWISSSSFAFLFVVMYLFSPVLSGIVLAALPLSS
ncbi:MAG: hypothetical protein M5U09_11845 [Gammaproteobacteria bacterium]|nr:hypothetical protein [Gammaproteobacteria bacterium]